MTRVITPLFTFIDRLFDFLDLTLPSFLVIVRRLQQVAVRRLRDYLRLAIKTIFSRCSVCLDDRILRVVRG